jgi:zinc protease
MKKALIMACLLALSALPAWAKPEKVKETKLPNGLVVHEYKLANGMQLLLVPDHSAPVFTYQVWFKVGSATEKLDPRLHRTGLAHFFEHMMFRGTQKVPEGEFDNQLVLAGAVDENANTWFDRTSYHESLPKEKLELAFQLESDRMGNLVINEEGFKNELGAVIGELKMRKDKPGSVLFEELWDLSFEQHPYKWTVIGSLDELHGFTVDDANYFYHTYYAPNDAALVLLGDFDLNKALTLAEKYYGHYPKKEHPALQPVVEPEQTKARRREISHPLATSNMLMVGYKIPDGNSPDIAALEVIGAILSTGSGSVMEEELVQTGIASAVSAGPSRYRYPGLFEVEITMAPGKSDDAALKVVNDTLERIRQGKVEAAELERAKNQYLLSNYTELLSLTSIGANLGEGLATTDNYLREFEVLEQIKKTTAADLQRVANAYLVESRSNFVRLVPGKGASK